MSSVNHGLVHVETGSVLVRHVYDLRVTGHTPFPVGTTVFWPSGNNGLITYDVAVSPTRIRLYVNVGTAPQVGDVINDGASTSCTVLGLAPTSPPNFSTALSGATVMKFAVGAGPPYSVSASNQTADSFELTEAFAENDAFQETPYSIHTGWTELGFPILDQGDRDAPGVISEGFAQANRRLRFYGARMTYDGGAGGVTPITISAVSQRIPFGQVFYDGAGAEQWANEDVDPNDTYKVIAGVKRVAISFVYSVVAVTSDVVVFFSLNRVGTGQIWEWSQATTGNQAIKGGGYLELAVVAANVFELQVRGSGSATLSAGDILWDIRATELT